MQIFVNGEPRQIDRPLKLVDLLHDLQLGERRIAVEINGNIVPRSTHPQTVLADGDEILIVQAIGGG